MVDYSAFVPNVTFEKIPIKNLVSNQDYQRNLSTQHVDKAVESFDLYQINPVKVSRRDGVNFVFNGQHTIEIVAKASQSRDTPVWCMIYDDLNYSHEADIFANQMKYVKPLSPYEIFKANIEAGNDKQLYILSLLKSYKLTVGPSKAPGVISAVATLESIHDKYGVQVLNDMLRLCIGTWEGDPNSFTANIMNAIAKIIDTYGDSLNQELFAQKVGMMSIKQLTRLAKDRRAGSLGFAEAMVLIYNGKKKASGYMLHINKLYSHSSARRKEGSDIDNDVSDELFDENVEEEEIDEMDGLEEDTDFYDDEGENDEEYENDEEEYTYPMI